MTPASHRRVPPPSGQRRLVNRFSDLELLERTVPFIVELGAELDRQLARERRPAERMRMLRETTNRITRAANDAVQAYARTSRTIRAELERPDGDIAGAQGLRTRLDTARQALLEALEVANQRCASAVDRNADFPSGPTPPSP